MIEMRNKSAYPLEIIYNEDQKLYWLLGKEIDTHIGSFGHFEVERRVQDFVGSAAPQILERVEFKSDSDNFVVCSNDEATILHLAELISVIVSSVNPTAIPVKVHDDVLRKHGIN